MVVVGNAEMTGCAVWPGLSEQAVLALEFFVFLAANGGDERLRTRRQVVGRTYVPGCGSVVGPAGDVYRGDGREIVESADADAATQEMIRQTGGMR